MKKVNEIYTGILYVQLKNINYEIKLKTKLRNIFIDINEISSKNKNLNFGYEDM